MSENSKTQATGQAGVDDVTPGGPSVGEMISAKAAQWGDGVTELGRMAANQIDHPRDAAADCLDIAAYAVYESAPNLPGGNTAAMVANTTADGLAATADYLRNHDGSAMIDDVKNRFRTNPVPMIVAALAVGILIGRAGSRTRN